MARKGTHGSPALDADAAKLEAMGADPGLTLEDLGETKPPAENIKLAHARGRVAEFDPEFVSDISEAVYRARVGPLGIERMEAEHGPGVARRNALSYDSLTRDYLRALKGKAW
jgi:hypothetical protein